MAKNGLFVRYCAKDFLDGTQALGPFEELAYRRICDLIYASGNDLRDDDRTLAWMTKTGTRWPRIKATLLDLGKIAVEDGRIVNARCTAELEKILEKIEQRSEAGKASVAARKTLKDNKTTPTSVDPPVPTGAQRNETLNHLTTEPRTQGEVIPLFGESNPTLSANDEFEAFWTLVPLKKGKGQARRAFPAARKKIGFVDLCKAMTAFAKSVAGKEARFIAHPATWLNGERWLDEDLKAPSGESARRSGRLAAVNAVELGREAVLRRYEED
jgi:uncharacterized protein YdaU (DUF1376 family)